MPATGNNKKKASKKRSSPVRNPHKSTGKLSTKPNHPAAVISPAAVKKFSPAKAIHPKDTPDDPSAHGGNNLCQEWSVGHTCADARNSYRGNWQWDDAHMRDENSIGNSYWEFAEFRDQNSDSNWR